jgi:hypothetical protein
LFGEVRRRRQGEMGVVIVRGIIQQHSEFENQVSLSVSNRDWTGKKR